MISYSQEKEGYTEPGEEDKFLMGHLLIPVKESVQTGAERAACQKVFRGCREPIKQQLSLFEARGLNAHNWLIFVVDVGSRIVTPLRLNLHHYGESLYLSGIARRQPFQKHLHTFIPQEEARLRDMRGTAVVIFSEATLAVFSTEKI